MACATPPPEPVIEEKNETPGYPGLVSAHSRAVASLSREIAAEIEALYATDAPSSTD